MIYYLSCRAHAYTIGIYLDYWQRALRDRMRVLHYEDLPALAHLPRGTYIFSDLDRLTPAQVDLATRVWERLADAGEGVRLLNHPLKAMRRYELLEALSNAGINRYRVYRGDESGIEYRFPVFLREAADHTGNLSPLLQDAAMLERVRSRAVRRGFRLEDLLVVEFCDTSDDAGIYRKYGAFRVGDRILPRHLLFSRDWVVKWIWFLGDQDFAREELAYLESNPHKQQLREIFDLARIEYGRIDYAITGDTIQVWEINTNPTAVQYPDEVGSRARLSTRFAEALRSAFCAIDVASPRGEPVAVHLDRALLERIKAERPPLAWRRLRVTIYQYLMRWSIVRVLHTAVKRWRARRAYRAGGPSPAQSSGKRSR